MKFWNELDNIKKKIYMSIGLLLIPASIFLHPAAAVKKIIKPSQKEQQIVTGDVLAQQNEGTQETKSTGVEKGSTVSRGGQVDRNSVYTLAQVIEGEAADEPYEGKVAVGAVILNRTKSSNFPHTIPGVIYETDAFESVSNGQYQRPLSNSSLNAAVDALNGSDPSGGALYFWNPAKASSPWVWSRPIINQIGGHVFAR